MTLREIYKENTDLSLAEALGTVGTEELLMDVLKQFCSYAEENISAIEQYMNSRDYENYTIKVHALKSTARTIGAKKLSDTARLLESFGKKAQEEDIDARKEILRHTPSCMELYLRASSSFSALFADYEEDEKEEVPSGFIEEFFTSVHGFAEDFDSDGIESLIEKMDKYRLPEDIRVRYSEFRKAFESSDWDAMCELSRS